MMLEAAPDQRWPMLLMAAVHLQTRRLGEPFPGEPGALLDYCRAHREALLESIRARSTQTNEVAAATTCCPASRRSPTGAHWR